MKRAVTDSDVPAETPKGGKGENCEKKKEKKKEKTEKSKETKAKAKKVKGKTKRD